MLLRHFYLTVSIEFGKYELMYFWADTKNIPVILLYLWMNLKKTVWKLINLINICERFYQFGYRVSILFVPRVSGYTINNDNISNVDASWNIPDPNLTITVHAYV